jgi:hypothetical protein
MRRMSIFLIILAFSFLFISCKEPTPSSPTTTAPTTTVPGGTTTTLVKPVIIRETGEGFDKIQEAIDAASPGQHIDVSSGTYTENLLVTKPLYLTGENRVTTVIKAGANPGVTFKDVASGSEIRGFTVQNYEIPPIVPPIRGELGGYSALKEGKSAPDFYAKIGIGATGIFCDGASVKIGRNIVKGAGIGVWFYYSPSGEVSGVLAKDSIFGVFVDNGHQRVSEVTATGNGFGIFCLYSSPIVSACTITNNYLWGVYCDSTQADFGGGAGGSPGLNIIGHSGGINAVGYDFFNYGPPIMAENNYWDHTTAADIDDYDIYDDDENAASGAVDFEPFLTSPPTTSLSMKPRLLYASSLFTDFFRSLFRGDLPASAMWLSPSAESRIRHAQYRLMRLGYRPITDERYYPPLMSRTGR